MDFNLDDPLAGILSDGSDDSFFDDDILGKKKTPSKKSTPISNKKNALFDLDEDANKSKTEPKTVAIKTDRDEKFKETKEKEIPAIGESVKAASPSPFRRTLSKESVSFNLKDLPAQSPAKVKPIIEKQSIEIKKPAPKSLERGKSSQSLLDDILGSPLSRPSTSQTKVPTRPTTAAKGQEFDFDSILGKNETKPTNKDTKDEKPKQIAKEPKKEIAPTKKTKSSDDWLGLFQDKNAAGDTEEEPGMPSWLGGGDKKKKEGDEIQPQPKPKSKEENHREVQKEIEPDDAFRNLSRVVQPSASSLGTSEDIAAEGAAVYLQQQEAQLMVALQLKAQDEKLAAMQMRQQESAKVHRESAKASQEQVEAMLRRQAEQRRQMQAVISAHQDRISERIKAMLGPPKANDDHDDANVNALETTTEVRETPHSKEKTHLLQLVQSLQDNHDKEIDLMETSYRRQLAFLEVSLNQAEERMKEESDKVVKFYTEKITWLEEHHGLYKKLVEDNMNALTERNKTENEMLRHQHLENVRILQEHHSTLMENVKNAVKQEQAVIQNAAGFSADLLELVADIKENKGFCQQLADKVQIIAEKSVRDGERSLETRDSQINDMMQQLKKERENFETEKTENRELVKLLESRLKQMTMLIEEESAAMKQKRMEFEFEKATFSKQTEFAKNVLRKQDEEVKMLKEEIQKEYQENRSRIDEEKAKAHRDSVAIAKEKSTLQSLRQELEKMKSDLHMQLEEVSEDRSKLNIDKQHIHMEEQRVFAKSRDLDLLAKAAMEKQTQADTKYAEAESIQRKYEERIRRIQEHVVSLNNREKQIARDKVALSRERLSLHNEKKQVEGLQQCSLCKSQNMPQYTYEAAYTTGDINGPVSRDYSAPYASSAVNAFESEMAHLLGRNLGLGITIGNHHTERNATVVGNEISNEPVNSLKEYVDPRLMMLRLDVQQVLSNLENSQKETNEQFENPEECKE